MLEGLTNGRLVLLNSRLKSESKDRTAALCHEMVHVYLDGVGERGDQKHGPRFRETLRRLLDEGAFEGIAATEEERAALRSSVDLTSERIDQESAAISRELREIDHLETETNSRVSEFNDRMERANQLQAGWPSGEEKEQLKEDREALNERMTAFNVRVKSFNSAVRALNRDIDRYNLMMSYPDGLDPDTLVSRRQSISAAKK